MHVSSLFQVLGVSKEPGGVSYELHEVHHQFALPPLSLHRGIRSAGNAAVRGTVRRLLLFPLFFLFANK